MHNPLIQNAVHVKFIKELLPSDVSVCLVVIFAGQRELKLVATLKEPSVLGVVGSLLSGTASTVISWDAADVPNAGLLGSWIDEV